MQVRRPLCCYWWWNFLPSTGGGEYVKTVDVTPDTGLSAVTTDGNVVLAGLDATTSVKGVVRLATQAELDASTPGVVPGADLIL